jgi:hypothetical protein
VGAVFYPSEGSCGGYTHGVFTAPTRCQATVVAAGVVFYERPRPSVWWAFACAAHVDELTAARALLDRDRAEIARRQRHPRGDGPGGEAVQPLARGRQARELIARVRRWADRHPEQLYPAAPPDRPPARE